MSASSGCPVASAMVGTSGRSEDRLALISASARNAAGLGVRQRRRQRGDGDRHVAADRGGHARAAAVERDVRNVGRERELEQLARQVGRRAATGRRIAQGAGIGPRHRDQLADAVRRHRRMHREHVGGRADQRDRREILVRIVGDFRIERRIGDEGAAGREDGVAVRRGARGHAMGDVAAAADNVLDVERLPEIFRQLLRDQARGGVALPARPGGDDHAHRTGRIGLRPREARDEGSSKRRLALAAGNGDGRVSCGPLASRGKLHRSPCLPRTRRAAQPALRLSSAGRTLPGPARKALRQSRSPAKATNVQGRIFNETPAQRIAHSCRIGARAAGGRAGGSACRAGRQGAVSRAGVPQRLRGPGERLYPAGAGGRLSHALARPDQRAGGGCRHGRPGAGRAAHAAAAQPARQRQLRRLLQEGDHP